MFLFFDIHETRVLLQDQIGFVIVLIAIGLIIELPAISRLKKESVKDDKVKEEKSDAAHGTWGNYCKAGVWILGLFAGVYLIGFIITVPIFTLTYVRWHGTTWHGSVIFATLLTAIIYIMFVYGLNVNMTKSFIFNLLTA